MELPHHLEARVHGPMVLETLQRLLHSDESIRGPAEQSMNALQQRNGAGIILMDIIRQDQDPSGDLTPIRLLAIICLKNALKKYWHTRGQRGVATTQQDVFQGFSEHEKGLLRETLLEHSMNETENQVATQLSVVIARIARTDWPQDWKALVPSIFQYLQNGSERQVKRAMYTLKRVLKELASRRLMMHKKAFNQLSAEIFPLIHAMWFQQTQGILSSLSNINAAATPNAVTPEEVSMYASQVELVQKSTKILFYMTIHGFTHLMVGSHCKDGGNNNNNIVTAYFSNIHESLQHFIECQKSLFYPPNHQGLNLLATGVDKVIETMSRVVMESQEQHPLAFRGFLTPYLTLFYDLIMHQTSEKRSNFPRRDRCLIHALSFLHNVTNCSMYRTSFALDASGRVVSSMAGDVAITSDMILEASSAVQTFFNANRIKGLSRHLITEFLVLQSDDVDEWAFDPEGFVLLQESLTSSTDSVRSQAENLMLTLLQNNRELLGSVLLLTEMLPKEFTVHTVWQASAQDMIRWDAIFLAIGLGAYDLHDFVDFEPWFHRYLVPCLQASAQSSGALPVPVLRRRSLWVLSCWLGQVTSEMKRGVLYDLLLAIMVEKESPMCDWAVRYSAVSTLHALLEDWSFERQAFLPFLSRVISSLYYVLNLTERMDTCLKVLSVLLSLVQVFDRMELVPHLEALVLPMPALWNRSTQQDLNLVKGQLLTILSELVASIGSHSIQLHPLLVPLLHHATDINQPDEVYLMEPGLNLWKEIIHQASEYTVELHRLFEALPKIVERDLEHVKVIVALIQSYALLGTSVFWADYGPSVAHIFLLIVGNVKPDTSSSICRVLDCLVRIYSPEELVQCLDVFQNVLASCLLSHEEDLHREPDMVVVGYQTVLARLYLHASNVFFACVEASAKSRSSLDGATSSQHIVVQLVDLYLSKFFSIVCKSVTPYRKKIWVCALIMWVATGEKEIMERLSSILDASVELLEELCKEKENGQGVELLRLSSLDNDTSNGTGEGRRVQQMHAKDQVFSIDMPQFIREKLQECERKIGAVAFQASLQGVDQSVLTKLMT